MEYSEIQIIPGIMELYPVFALNQDLRLFYLMVCADGLSFYLFDPLH